MLSKQSQYLAHEIASSLNARLRRALLAMTVLLGAFRLFLLAATLLLIPQIGFPSIEGTEQDAASLRNTKEIDDQTVKSSEGVSFVRPDGEILQEKIDSLQKGLQGIQSFLKELDDRLRRVESLLEELTVSRKKELPLRVIGSSRESASDAR